MSSTASDVATEYDQTLSTEIDSHPVNLNDEENPRPYPSQPGSSPVSENFTVDVLALESRVDQMYNEQADLGRELKSSVADIVKSIGALTKRFDRFDKKLDQSEKNVNTRFGFMRENFLHLEGFTQMRLDSVERGVTSIKDELVVMKGEGKSMNESVIALSKEQSCMCREMSSAIISLAVDMRHVSEGLNALRAGLRGL